MCPYNSRKLRFNTSSWSWSWKIQAAGTVKCPFKGTVTRDFLRLHDFSLISFLQALSIPLEPFKFFSKIRGVIHSSRCTIGAGVVFIVFLGLLWEVELTYRLLFSFKFTLRCQHSDIVTILFAAGVVDTSGNLPPVSFKIHEKNLKQKISWHCPFKRS